MALRSDDKIAIVKTTGGGKQEEFTLDELNTFISTEEDARVTALETKINKAIDGAPVQAVAANQTLTLTGNVTAADTVVIGTTTYTFVNDLTTDTAYMVVKGATASDTLDNLIAAINKAAGESVTYGTGTVAHPLVTATAGAGDTMLVTAKVKGTAYNTTPTTNPIDSGSKIGWGDTTLKGGIDGTVGGKGTLRFSDNNFWIATADCIVSDATAWKTIIMQYPEIVTIDLSTGNDYTIPTDAPPSFIVVTNTDGSDGDIFLPPATGSLNKITISIQKAANNIVVNPAAAPGTDTINLASSLTVTALATVTLLDYADGKWIGI